MKNFDGKNILITGGSSGIGLALAKNFSEKGANIWLMARDRNKLESACTQVSQLAIHPSQQFGLIVADIANQEDTTRSIQDHITKNGTPDLLVNSAGITHPGLFTEMALDYHRSNMEINYFGTLYTTMAVVPGMVARKSGYILNISSLVGIHGLYGYSAYSPSKFAVRGLSDVLRYELKPYGIDVSVAFPSDTITPQLDYENAHKPVLLKVLSESNTKAASAEFVAQKIINGLKKKRYLILPTADAVSWYIVYSLLPGESMYWMVDILMNRARGNVAKRLASKQNKANPD